SRAPPCTALRPLSLHAALPLSPASSCVTAAPPDPFPVLFPGRLPERLSRAPPAPHSPPPAAPGFSGRSVLSGGIVPWDGTIPPRSEEHTSELQSREKLVCRLLL